MKTKKGTSQELTRGGIIQEAREQFVRNDYRQVSMRNIAKKLGCSHGAIYYHFKNKAELFYAIVEKDFTELNQEIDDIVNCDDMDDNEKLYNLFLRFISFGLNHQNQFEIMFMIRHAEVDSLSQQSASLSYHKFANAIQQMVSQPIAVKIIWSAFISLLGFVSHYRGYVNSFKEAEGAAKTHVLFTMKALIDS
ncbi:TetR/AcrR family transcriptional regulator [Salipaludibacillus daqingensis]|uniref:TetR/AcrR family transcriptional regulator n=1 Tax=Salipaludibacillus daqingensis TaxID=3041001 RepID=UPI002475575F|nr:TetR/AcrR family transcriptional regulator [Salipaludibacillus daqingensis]